MPTWTMKKNAIDITPPLMVNCGLIPASLAGEDWLVVFVTLHSVVSRTTYRIVSARRHLSW